MQYILSSAAILVWGTKHTLRELQNIMSMAKSLLLAQTCYTRLTSQTALLKCLTVLLAHLALPFEPEIPGRGLRTLQFGA
jgi:hypothetical protein